MATSYSSVEVVSICSIVTFNLLHASAEPERSPWFGPSRRQTASREWPVPAGCVHVLPRSKRERAGRTDGRAHRPLAGAGAVVAHVALHHLVDVAVVLRHAERAGEHAVRAADAARLQRALDDAVRRLLDRVGRADLRADRDPRSACRPAARSARCRGARWSRDGSASAPRCVSHSSHACTQAWQPMQRE